MESSKQGGSPSNQAQEKKLLDPETNLISISTQKPAKFFIYIAKIFLKKFEVVELSSLGGAAEVAVQVAENLSRYMPANLDST